MARLAAGVHFHDLDAALQVGQREAEDAVEAARARERLVQHAWRSRRRRKSPLVSRWDLDAMGWAGGWAF